MHARGRMRISRSRGECVAIYTKSKIEPAQHAQFVCWHRLSLLDASHGRSIDSSRESRWSCCPGAASSGRSVGVEVVSESGVGHDARATTGHARGEPPAQHVAEANRAKNAHDDDQSTNTTRETKRLHTHNTKQNKKARSEPQEELQRQAHAFTTAVFVVVVVVVFSLDQRSCSPIHSIYRRRGTDVCLSGRCRVRCIP